MRIRQLRLYDEYNYRAVIGKEKKCSTKANRCEVSKTYRLHSTVALQQPGTQLQGHAHCAGQGVAQYFQGGLPSQDSAGIPGVGNDVRDDDVAGENVGLSELEKLGLGHEGGNDYTNCT